MTAKERGACAIDFPYRFFNKFQGSNEVGYVYTLNSDGETIDYLMLVPCGKCNLCLKNRRKDFANRCVCETVGSDFGLPPLFVTLTFSMKSMPYDGVSVRDIQLFMKRFRNFFTSKGYKINIRYVACGEYGSHTKHPHYHLLLWNVPVLDEDVEKLASGIPYNFIIKDYIERGAWSYGHAFVGYLRKGGVDYVLKYMSKQRRPPSDGVKMNKPFITSSRRPGIGLNWLKQNEQLYRKNIELTDVEVFDRWTGRNYKFSLPKYFIKKLYPSECTLVPPEFRRAVRSFVFVTSVLKSLCDDENSKWCLIPEAERLLNYFKMSYDSIPRMPSYVNCWSNTLFSGKIDMFRYFQKWHDQLLQFCIPWLEFLDKKRAELDERQRFFGYFSVKFSSRKLSIEDLKYLNYKEFNSERLAQLKEKL